MRRVVAVTILLLLAAGCGSTAPPTPQSLGGGLVRYFPQSSPAEVNQPTPIVLSTHCGLDQALIDFAGSLWQPAALPPGDGGVVAGPQLVNDPHDRGMITLLADGNAAYVAETGRTILLRPVRGPRDLMLCY